MYSFQINSQFITNKETTSPKKYKTNFLKKYYFIDMLKIAQLKRGEI